MTLYILKLNIMALKITNGVILSIDPHLYKGM